MHENAEKDLLDILVPYFKTRYRPAAWRHGLGQGKNRGGDLFLFCLECTLNGEQMR